MYYIYEIYNQVTQRRYIGVTADLKKRFKGHLTNLRNATHTAENIVKDFVKYGEDSFVFRIVDMADTKEEGLNKERKYILKLKTYVPEYGYNGNDKRFFQKKFSRKAPDTELTREIHKKGYRYRDISLMLKLKYTYFIAKLNHPENFTEDEITKINDFLKITARQRWANNLWWFQMNKEQS